LLVLYRTSCGIFALCAGDVLLHCVVDAILGALGLPDIGQIFPDTDPRWKGAESSVFMREAVSFFSTSPRISFYRRNFLFASVSILTYCVWLDGRMLNRN
jgi:2-C-methyl-D-erythritol 2,4-cyclodiphosphate synthase